MANSGSMKKHYIIAGIIILSSFCLHLMLILNSDIAWLSHLAQAWLNGKRYYTGFFETNPPMIIWFYIPTAWLSAYWPGHYKLLVLTYLFLVATALLLWNGCQMRRINWRGRHNAIILFYALVIVCFIVPVKVFGKREFLAWLSMLPLVWLLAQRLRYQTIPVSRSIAVAVIAGLGMVLKPFFIMPIIAMEICFMIYKRSLFSWLRTEMGVLLVVGLVYIFSVLVLAPHYFTDIVPDMLVSYSYLEQSPLWKLLIKPNSLTFLTLSVTLCVSHKTWRWPVAIWLLWANATGFWLGYLWSGQYWFYHLFPAFASSALATAYCLALVLSQAKQLLPRQLLIWSCPFLAILLLGVTCHFFQELIVRTLVTYDTSSAYNYIRSQESRLKKDQHALSLIPYMQYKSLIHLQRHMHYWLSPPLVLLLPTLYNAQQNNPTSAQNQKIQHFKHHINQKIIQALRRKPAMLILPKSQIRFPNYKHGVLYDYKHNSTIHRLIQTNYKKVNQNWLITIWKRRSLLS